jgi:DNA-binding GntR family transcriptional regulator
VIRRSTLREQVATALRDEIVAGRLPAGREFTVKEIAEQYGVSATPVREALVDLAAQGLLDVQQHRGFRVHEFSAADYRAMVEARELVMDGVFRWMEREQDADAPPRQDGLASVRRRAVAAERAARAGDLDVLIGYDLRFWRELGTVVHNPYVRDFLDRIRTQCWAFAVPVLRREETLAGRLWTGHRELLDAVERLDVEAARRLLTANDAHALTLVEDA